MEEKESILSKLLTIQTKLKAPKGQYNEFGKYYYRSCEDILEAVKPLLAETGTVLKLTDEIIEMNGRFYVKATAILMTEDEEITNTAYAREDETKKGMDGSQITGSCSTYARKYALNGLFLIDDTRDADTMDNREEAKKEEPKKKTSNKGTNVPEQPTEPKMPKKTVKEEIEEDLNRRVTKEEVQAIIAGCKENGVDVSKICKLYKKESLPELSAYQFKHIFSNWERIKGAK